MEELSKASSAKNSEHKSKSKETPQIKIDELHNLIQSYLNKHNRIKIQSILPTLQKVKQDIKIKQQQINLLKQSQIGQNHLKGYYQMKKNLTEQLKALNKKIQKAKDQMKSIKMKKSEISQQFKKNSQILKQLEQKFENQNKDCKKINKSICCLPRISGLNFDLLHQDPRKRATGCNIQILNTARSSQKPQLEDRDNFFNSLNFHRLKQIEKLLDQITTGSPIYKVEKQITGDNQQSIAKKVFKKFSTQEYFDSFFKRKKFFNLLLKIQNE